MNSRQLRARTISLFVAINFLAMTLTAISVKAQTNTLPTTGNVGIGTTTPEMPLEVNGFYKLQDVRHYRIVRTYGSNVGDWAQIGSFANTGVSQYGEFQVQGHWCGSIVSRLTPPPRL